MGNPNRKEEPFGFEARELVRNKLIGKKVTFKLEYMANGKRFISVKLPGEDGQDLATFLVSESMARVNDKRGNTEEGSLHHNLLALQTEISKKTKNIWNKDSVF